MSCFFVTGTDTEVGKTVVTCALLRRAVAMGYRAAGMKPLASGGMIDDAGRVINDDVTAHGSAGNVDLPLALVNPYAFVPPISPHLAANQAGVTIEFDKIIAALAEIRSKADFVVVEGAGGWLAPLDEQRTMADLACALDIPVVLVVGLRLGCLNHAMLTANAIVASGANLAGWVANAVDPQMRVAEENIEYLKRHISAPFLGLVPNFDAERNSESNQEQMLNFAHQILVK